MVSETVVSPAFGVPTKPVKDGPNSVFNKLVTEFESLDRKITYEILKKDTWGSFRNWSQQDMDLETTMFQMTHGMGGYGMTPNVITQMFTKVDMSSTFLGFVGSMSSPEQKLWFPNQNV